MKKKLSFILSIFLVTGLYAQSSTDSSFSQLFAALKSEPDPVKKEYLGLKMENRAEGPNAMLLDYSRQMIADAFAEAGDVKKAVNWCDRITDSAIKDNAVFSVARELTQKGKLAEAEKLIMPVWEKAKSGNGASGGGMMRAPTSGDFAMLYGTILYKQGQYKKALGFLTPAERSRPNELYAMALAKAGEEENALQEMATLLLAPGHRTAEFTVIAKSVFQKKDGDLNRYNRLIDSAEVIANKKMADKVNAMMVSEAAPDFELTNINGNKVSLKSLKGKTVILDFWATWCQPCVASFPGMQKAVDYYKKDSSVVFMFIHTAEKSVDPVGDVKRFMTYKKYRFDIYMDLKDKSTHQSPVARSFNVGGIPAKFVIDKNGMIRFKNTGFISEDEAVKEIKMMVDRLNKG